MSGIHRKRCKRYNVPGHAHYLTFSCFHRQPFLTLDPPRRWLTEALVAARSKIAFDLWAYIIMPEHAHLLVWPREATTVSEILRLVKLPVVKRARLWAHGHHAFASESMAPTTLLHEMADTAPNGRASYRFWQRGGGYDRNLWSPEEIHEKIHYIHANPVRRGLIERLEDWPWSSYATWMNVGEPVVPIDKHSVPAISPR
jgi:putative transposase